MVQDSLDGRIYVELKQVKIGNGGTSNQVVIENGLDHIDGRQLTRGTKREQFGGYGVLRKGKERGSVLTEGLYL